MVPMFPSGPFAWMPPLPRGAAWGLLLVLAAGCSHPACVPPDMLAPRVLPPAPPPPAGPEAPPPQREQVGDKPAAVTREGGRGEGAPRAKGGDRTAEPETKSPVPPPQPVSVAGPACQLLTLAEAIT